MRITIDNLDGQGALDYSRWVAADGRTGACPDVEPALDLRVSPKSERFRFATAGAAGARCGGKRRQFRSLTGYVATRPELLYLGIGHPGAMYAVHVRAISDEWLLDRQGVTAASIGLQMNGVSALGAMTNRTGVSGFTTSGSAAVGSMGVFVPERDGNWSKIAGDMIDSVFAAYRVVGGTIGVQPAGAVTHTLGEGDGALQLGGLHMGMGRELANDVTVSGELEPAAYITESFAGDGTTAEFTLQKTPFRHGINGGGGLVLTDSFDGGVFNKAMWRASDPGSHLSLTAGGLTSNGGSGLDGQTSLEALDPVELGGVLTVEMGAVQLHGGSDGVLCGLYSGDPRRPNCIAGYNVRQSNGATVLVPLVGGVEMGSAYTVQEGHRYVLRLRVHSVEPQRIRQLYYAMAAGVVKSFGGGLCHRPWTLSLICRTWVPRPTHQPQCCTTDRWQAR